MAAMEKNNKTLNVPHLRFPEFSGEWEKQSLGATCNVLMCKRILASQTNTEGGVPFYKIGTIGSIADAYISRELFETYRAKYNYPRKGEVMITCAGTVGKTMLFNGHDSYYQDSNIVWIDNPNNHIDNTFLYHFLSRVDWSRLNTTTIVRIYNDDLRQLRISYPSKEEQKKISDLLNLLDQRIETQKKIIEKYESLIRGLYHSVFNQPASVLQLKDVVSVVKGKQVNGDALLEEGKFYVMNGGTEPSGYLDEYNTPANTISISEGGNSCGYVQYNTEPFWSGGHCYSLIHKEKDINYQYLYHFLKYKERDIMALRIGSGLPNVQKKDLERFEIRVLPTEQQSRITEILQDVSANCDLEKRILQGWQCQKVFLLRNLFI